MPKELALQKVGWNGAAIYGDKTIACPSGKTMDRLCNQFLAGARFAEDQDRAVGRGNAAHQGAQLAHGRRVADQGLQNFGAALTERRGWPTHESPSRDGVFGLFVPFRNGSQPNRGR